MHFLRGSCAESRTADRKDDVFATGVAADHEHRSFAVRYYCHSWHWRGADNNITVPQCRAHLLEREFGAQDSFKS